MPQSAEATTMVPLGVEDLTFVADLVIEAEVEQAVPEREPGSEYIRSHYTLRITQVLKGDAFEGDAVLVRSFGGIVGDDLATMVNAPTFTPGERVIVFLEVVPREEDIFRVVGLDQGKFTLIEEKGTGLDILVHVNAPHGTPHFDEARVKAPAVRRYSKDLRARILADVDLAFVPAYKTIPGIPAHKDAAMRLGSMEWGHDVDPRLLAMPLPEVKR
jgi:hypothetical protein